MRRLSKAGLGILGVTALMLTQATPAHADHAPEAVDVVGVGSDTIQFAVNFLADGDYLGNPGVNSSGARVINFDATGDANGKLTNGAGVVLRAGTVPVTRPNGTGGGINYMNNSDKGAVHKVQFARMSRPPSKAEDDAAAANGWGGLHCYQMALDGLKIAVSNQVTTNAGTNGISKADLVQIFSATGTIRNWGQVSGWNGPGAAANTPIVPILPPSTSGTEQFFIQQLGLTEAQVRADVVRAEEHDPSAIQGNANAIAPFSTARIVMIHNGYFNNGTPLSSDPVKLLNAGFSTTRPVYIVVRQSEVNQKWNKDLFAPGGFMSTSFLAQPLIGDAAGFNYQYADAGLCHTA